MNSDISPYIHRLGLQHASFSRIEHDDAIVAEVYKVTLPSGATYALKICKQLRHYQHELFFLSHFATRIPVPQIIQLVPPEEHLSGAILMEYLPGELLSTQVITEDTAHKLGTILAKIHAQRAEEYGDIGKYPGNRHYANAHDYVTEKFDDAFAECIKHLSQDLLEKSRQYYDAHLSQLSTVDGPCLTHRDFRPANIIVSNGKLQGVIDWSSSRAGFAEEDFIPLESDPSCALSASAGKEWSIGIQAKEAFLRGYATVRAVPDYKAIMPFLQLVRAFFTIGYTIKSGTWKSSGTRAYQNSLQIIRKTIF